MQIQSFKIQAFTIQTIAIAITLFGLMSSGACFAQVATTDDNKVESSDTREKVDYPDADIFLFPISKTENGAFTLGKGENVTDRAGYENQPFFTADSKSFLFSQSDDYQTDVFEHFFDSGETKQVTDTPNMEFSPTPSPDNQKISFVTDGEGANQSIWHLTRSDPTKPTWTLANQPEREPVGYYSWNHESGYILFWSRYGHAMKLVHESKELSHYISGNAIPTTPWIIPGTQNFSFVHRQANGEVWIKELDPNTRSITPIVAISGSNHHYNWAPDGSIVMMQGTKLQRWVKDSKTSWNDVADLEEQGVGSASRVAVSPNGKWLAVVGVPIEGK